ncbi:TPA: sulfurtransferase-like selenium metabolism protein YedF [bacterium]|nr:sulfurtransferase-like selenium metabolism protein YedF [bacterium]
MNKILDARGWACPKPVIETRKALQTDKLLTVIVDNKPARENVSRLATKMNCKFTIDEKNDGIYINIDCEGSEPIQENTQEEYITCETGKNIVLVIATDTVGKGSDELGGILMRAFMHTFLEVKPSPETIIFMNNGVKLAIKGSPVLEDLQELSNRGVEILVCGTCTNYFGITDNVAVGIISNAYNIAEAMLNADKVVNL